LYIHILDRSSCIFIYLCGFGFYNIFLHHLSTEKNQDD
jgi:hypothetical protein